MKFDEIVEMYIDWAYGRDDEIHQSDVLCACFDYGFTYDEIVKVGDKKAEKLKL